MLLFIFMKTLIAEGAEAKIYKFNIGNNYYISKERISKTYRIKEIDDNLRKYRTRREISILERTSKLISVPKVNKASSERDYTIIMEFIDGDILVNTLDFYLEDKRNSICKEIGKQLALLHNHNIIHGDLTTSNIIFKNKVFFIDFGLSFIDEKQEHKAVDLHLLKQALESKHYKHFEESFKYVIEGYKENSDNYKIIFNRLEKVEKRGRYKSKNKN